MKWIVYKISAFLLALVALSGCGEGPPAPDLFSLPVAYSVGKKPAAIVAQDMNADGYPDLLVANSASNTLNYLEGLGDGTFKDPVSMNTGREPSDGDGNVSIILSQKDGLFRKKGEVKVGRLPIAIKAGDFNNDEKMDLAVTLRFDKMVILLGVGDGTFKLAEAYKASGTPANFEVGDFNNDKNLDIAMAFNAVKVKFIRIFDGNGDGTFQPPRRIAGGHQSSFITQYDINGDGLQDLITSSTMADSLTLFLGQGEGKFEAATDFAGEKGPEHIVAGEFTGDRIPDVVVCNRRDNSISILEGKGDGSFFFPHFNYPVGRNPRAMAGADFNGDGMTDLAIVLYDSQKVIVLIRKVAEPPSIES
jgi:hypothetical protein